MTPDREQALLDVIKYWREENHKLTVQLAASERRLLAVFVRHAAPPRGVVERWWT